MKRVAVLGAGGHAAETAWTIEELRSRGSDLSFAGYIVKLGELLGPSSSVIGDEAWMLLNRDSFDGLAVGVGMPALRMKIARQHLPEFSAEWWPVLIHPTAVHDPRTCKFGEGVMIGAGAILTVNVRIGPFALANFGCTIGHDTVVGSGSVIMPGANVAGNVVIGDAVLVGTGAQILEGLKIGDGARVGAGAVVVSDVPAGVTVVGCPAAPLKSK